MSYAYPSVPDLGRADAHAARDVREGRRSRRLPAAARRGRPRGDRARSRAAAAGLPARVIPLEVHHVASIGLDVWLAALAHGASQVAVLVTGAEAPQYREALERADARSPTRSRRRWATRASTSACSTAPTRRRSTRRCGRGRQRSAVARRRDVRVHRRQAHDGGARDRAPRAARAGAAARDRAARRARRSARSSSTATPARCASRASARVPKARSSTTRRRRSSRFIETKCVQCGTLRDDVPRARDHARAAPLARRRRRGSRAC